MCYTTSKWKTKSAMWMNLAQIQLCTKYGRRQSGADSQTHVLPSHELGHKAVQISGWTTGRYNPYLVWPYAGLAHGPGVLWSAHPQIIAHRIFTSPANLDSHLAQ